MAIAWHAIVVDDKQGDEVGELLETSPAFKNGDTINVTIITDFEVALEKLHTWDFDFIILDLKDDSLGLPDEKSLRGKEVFDAIRKTRFAPVIFYTAFPNRVDVSQNDFVKIVTRGEINDLESAVSAVLETKLMHLARHIEEQKRNFMWDFVEKNWEELDEGSGLKGELAHTLARRLSDSLKKSAIRFFSEGVGSSEANNVHPIEMYIVPPTDFPALQAGDIVKGSDGNYCLVLTPTCDLVPKKGGKLNADYVLLAKCVSVSESAEFNAVKASWTKDKKVSNGSSDKLLKLIQNNRTGQPSRYFFLPAVLELFPELIVDFQQISCITREGYEPERVASLDSPYSELIVQKLGAFLGRIGAPDLDSSLVYERIIQTAKVQ